MEFHHVDNQLHLVLADCYYYFEQRANDASGSSSRLVVAKSTAVPMLAISIVEIFNIYLHYCNILLKIYQVRQIIMHSFYILL